MQTNNADVNDTSKLIQTMAELSKGNGTANKSVKTVFGSDQMSWKEVDEAVNEYPGERTFTAIGEGTLAFQEAMVSCVERELNCKVHEEAILVRPSKGGKYVSVKIGPVVVTNPDQVVNIFGSMKQDPRLKWYI